MIDFDGQDRQALLFSFDGLQRRGGNELLEHQARRIDHEVAPVGAGQVLGVVKGQAPAGKGFGQGRVVDFGGEPRVLEQQVHVAFEGPQDGPEAARLMAQIVDLEDFGFKGSEHLSSASAAVRAPLPRW